MSDDEEDVNNEEYMSDEEDGPDVWFREPKREAPSYWHGNPMNHIAYRKWQKETRVLKVISTEDLDPVAEYLTRIKLWQKTLSEKLKLFFNLFGDVIRLPDGTLYDFHPTIPDNSWNSLIRPYKTKDIDGKLLYNLLLIIDEERMGISDSPLTIQDFSEVGRSWDLRMEIQSGKERLQPVLEQVFEQKFYEDVGLPSPEGSDMESDKQLTNNKIKSKVSKKKSGLSELKLLEKLAIS
jgi:hypothetical protein